MKTSYVRTSCASALLLLACASVRAAGGGELNVPSPDWRDQIIYFVMLDRFSDGDPANDDQGAGEYDPAKASHYSGGDLKGLAEKIPYIKGLGATAVWITPPVAHQWWSEAVNYGGYHGYWGEDFMSVDRHFGDLEDMRGLSRRLHSEGMYLIQDIVVNHTGNYFSYDPALWDPADPARGYRREKAAGQGEAPGLSPFDLNDARDPVQAAQGVYHWTPDISDPGDREQELNWQLSGLDDLDTENGRVRETLRRSYAYWIREAGVDGFRVDTAFHVPQAFFRDFLYSDDARNPGVMRAAEAEGKKDFLAFGEGFGVDKPYEDAQSLKIESYAGDAEGALLPGMLNFPLYGAIKRVFAEGLPTSELRYRIETMMRVHKRPHLMPSFVDNHDLGRFLAGGSEAALKQGLLLIMTLPGIPVVYYGTEQGFTEVRGAMFAAGYASGGLDRFDEKAPLYGTIREMAGLRRSSAVFTRGVPEVLKHDPAGAGVFAYRMRLGDEQALVLFNSSDHEALLDNLPTGLPAGQELDTVFALGPFPEKTLAGKGGLVSAALPARCGAVLMPGAPGPAGSVHGAPPTVDPLPSFVEGDTLAVSGRGAEAPFVLVLDGDLSRPVKVTPGPGGRWRASVPIGAFTDEKVPHRITAWREEDAAASPARVFRVRKTWEPVITAEDPKGDDAGRSGALRYPFGAGWDDKRQCDIEKVSILRSGGALRIDVRLRGMTRLWGPPNGFDHAALTVFLEMPGREGGARFMPEQNGELPEDMRWHYRMRVHGWSNALFGPDGAGPDKEGTALSPGIRVEADPESGTVSIIAPAAALGYPDGTSGMKIYINTWDYAEGYRPLSKEGGEMTFGGGRPEDTKVMDETAVIVLP